MQHVASIRIDASPETVWDIVADVERWPEWTESMETVTRVDDGPLRDGSSARVKQPRLPAVVWHVTEVEPGRSFTWEARAPGMLSVASHRIETVDGATVVTLSIRQSGPLAFVAALTLGRLTRRYVAMEAEGLRRRAEGTAGS